jgi:hypothetical protein
MAAPPEARRHLPIDLTPSEVDRYMNQFLHTGTVPDDKYGKVHGITFDLAETDRTQRDISPTTSPAADTSQ